MLIIIKKIKICKQQCLKYATLDFYIDSQISKKRAAIAYIKKEIHIIKNLGPKMLIKIDVIGLEQISLDTIAKQLILHQY